MDYVLNETITVPDASPGEIFDLITDLDRLPDWNLEIPAVLERPPVLEVGAEWLVTIHAMHLHWNSRSRVVELDRDKGRFRYRSQSDDGNPSYADWSWQLTPAPGPGRGTNVDLAVDVHLLTFLRRTLLSEIRKPVLRKAMHESLTALREASSQSTSPR